MGVNLHSCSAGNVNIPLLPRDKAIGWKAQGMNSTTSATSLSSLVHREQQGNLVRYWLATMKDSTVTEAKMPSPATGRREGGDGHYNS